MRILFIFCMLLGYMRALYLPMYETVTMYVSSYANNSEAFLELFEPMKDEFDSFKFKTVWVEPKDLEVYGTVRVPSATVTYDNRKYSFSYPFARKYVRRWLCDARYGRFSLYENVTLTDSFLSEAHNMWVHILSAEKPDNSYLSHKLPEVAFAWSRVNNTNNKNTVLIRDIFGNIHQRTNFSSYNLLHVLLPPIIPQWILDTDEGISLYNVLAKREVTIVTDDTLHHGWHSLAMHYPNTAFVQTRTNETNVTHVPSVWFQRRSVVYMFPSLNASVQDWLSGIRVNKTQPYRRPSRAPVVAHPTIVDVTGDTFWSWSGLSTERILYLYGMVDNCYLSHQSEYVSGLGILLGRMNISSNDHEQLPIEAESGSVLVFKNDSFIKMTPCSHFDLPRDHLEL
jgi:hypothetical protein